MRTMLALICLLIASDAFAADCATGPRGRVVCDNGQRAVAVNPKTGNINTVGAGQSAGAMSVRSSSGNGAAAYNPRTGNAAVAEKNQNGVTTTQTTSGGESKSKNGNGVYRAPDGTKCVKTANNKGCT